MPNALPSEGSLYRAIYPDQYDSHGPKPAAFQDTGGRQGQRADDLSFTIESPRAALSAIANRRAVKDLCATGNRPPTPEEMWSAGFRVSSTPIEYVRAMVASEKNTARLKLTDSGDEVGNRGHVGIVDGDRFAAQLASKSTVLLDRGTVDAD